MYIRNLNQIIMEKPTIKSHWETPEILNLDIDQTESGSFTPPTETTILQPRS